MKWHHSQMFKWILSLIPHLVRLIDIISLLQRLLRVAVIEKWTLPTDTHKHYPKKQPAISFKEHWIKRFKYPRNPALWENHMQLHWKYGVHLYIRKKIQKEWVENNSNIQGTEEQTEDKKNPEWLLYLVLWTIVYVIATLP